MESHRIQIHLEDNYLILMYKIKKIDGTSATLPETDGLVPSPHLKDIFEEEFASIFVVNKCLSSITLDVLHYNQSLLYQHLHFLIIFNTLAFIWGIWWLIQICMHHVAMLKYPTVAQKTNDLPLNSSKMCDWRFSNERSVHILTFLSPNKVHISRCIIHKVPLYYMLHTKGVTHMTFSEFLENAWFTCNIYSLSDTFLLKQCQISFFIMIGWFPSSLVCMAETVMIEGIITEIMYFVGLANHFFICHMWYHFSIRWENINE